MLERHYKNLTDDDVSYGEYRKSFAFISQFFGLPKNEIIVEWLEFEPAKNNEPERVALRYSKGLFKVNLPPDVRLIHIAPVDGITQLQPAFRSKTKGKFMYPSKRCFFTVGKAINPFKNGMVTSKNPITQIKQRAEAKIFKYTTKADKVGDVYIDPTYNQIGDSSVMIITDKPIPVMKFEDKMSQIFSSLKKMVTGNKKKDEPVEEAHIFQRGDFDEYKEYCDLDFVDTHEKVDVNLEITGINKHESNFDDLDAFMEAEVISEHDFRKFMQVCTKQFPEKYRRCISRFDEDDEEELSDFLQGYSKTLAVGYFDCRRLTRDSNVISNEIIPELRKFCKEVSGESDIFKLYISDADGLDIFFDVKRKEVVKEENSWYDSEAQELIESFEYDYDVLDEGALKDFIETIKNWKTSNNNHAQRSFKSNSITDEEYEELKKIIETLTASDVKYRDYKKAFKDLCTFCHTIPTGTIITKYNLKKGDKDHNILEVEYGENTKKMKLPEGVKLFHMSKVPNIQKLIPQFRGKAERGYLYEKPRIYFTINKYMPRFLADYTKGEKVYKYEVKENIQDVYVDPLVWNVSQGAVYIETNNPVPVKEVKDSLVKDVVDTVNPLKKKEEEKDVEESSVYNFYGDMESVNEANDLYKMIPKDKANVILKCAKAIMKDINNEIKASNDKDFEIGGYYRFSIDRVTFIFNYKENMPILRVVADFYDFKKAKPKVFSMFEQKLSQYKELSEFTFKYNDQQEGFEVMMQGAERSANNYNDLKNEIDSEFDYNNPSKINNGVNNSVISAMKRKINSDTTLNRVQKQMLIKDLDVLCAVCKDQLDVKNRMENDTSEEITRYREIYSFIANSLSKAGFPKSNKTWYTDGYDMTDYGYMKYKEYDNTYSGAGNDYDNGLTADDKAMNRKFISTLNQVISKAEKQFNCKITADCYRGFGEIYVDLL